MTTFNVPAQVDKSWTLFLDRDGVINVETVGSYVANWDEFRFCEGALEALKTLSEVFGNIVIVTNQRGVGKGIMTMESLKDINVNMTNAIADAGGRIDRIYACTAVLDTDHNRKPNTGMAYQAKEDYPDIDFKRSVIVGNSISDMEFGKRLAMHTVFLTTKHEPFMLPHDLIDEQYDSLLAWANSVKAGAAEAV
jgi:D-glycero-D-manno-heptose 1,7-bisphosphate phosphatase